MGKRGLTARGALLGAAVLFGSLLIGLLMGAQPASAATGCFTEPSFPSICTFVDKATAESFCSATANPQACLASYFLEGVSCSAVSICAFSPGTWCGDTCRQVERQAQCSNRAAWLNQTSTPSQCQPGCCICDKDAASATENVCEANINQQECSATCSRLIGYRVGLFDPALSGTQCTNLCSTFTSLRGTVAGHVTSGNQPLAGVTVSALGIANLTDAAGFYVLNSLPVGTLTITATKEGFEPAQAQVTLAAEEQRTVNLALIPAVTGTIRGTVLSTAGQPIAGARITVSGQTTAQSLTDAQGAFQAERLPFGNYIVQAEKSGFETATRQASIDALAPIRTLTLTLAALPQATITGQVRDQQGNPVPFAEVIINGALATFSAGNGFYTATVHADADGETYTMTAAKASYLADQPQSVTVTLGSTATVPLTLTALAGECLFPVARAVQNFAASHVPGKPSVLLSWRKPCPEVRGYAINRTVIQPNIGQSRSEQIAFLDVVHGLVDPVSFTDENAAWQTTYEYAISAVYTDGTPRQSAKATARITAGNPLCEGKFQSGRFTEFCQQQVLRRTCTSENQLIAAGGIDPADCSTLGATVFCAGPDVAGNTYCADAGVCSSQSQQANPFGLYFTRDACYGAFSSGTGRFQNACYFDQGTTVVDACFSCQDVESCFDYRSEDACQTNSCLGQRCRWVDALVELSTGYCVPQDYGKADHCSDCSKQGQLFENARCTGSICDSLGACYANADQSSCVSCSAASSCYDFLTQAECSGGRDAQFSFGALAPSADACTLGRCSWNPAASSCFKDGNGDGIDDCASFSDNALHVTLCQRDSTPPVTVISPDVIRINGQTGIVSFRASDVSAVPRLYYCVDRTNTCLPNATSFTGYVSGTASLSLVPELRRVYSGSGTYFIRYASEDIFSNREDLQSKSITADLAPPEFILLNYTIALNASGSDVTFTIALNEHASCTDKLISYNRRTSFSDLPQQRNQSWTITYARLPDGLYRYDVRCTDDVGNNVTGVLDLIEVDALAFIRIVSPARALKETAFSFILNTSEDSRCDLLENSTLLETLTTADFTVHRSRPRTFATNTFYTGFSARCTELASGEVHEKAIPFTIDELAPQTTIKITSVEGLLQSFETTGWEAKVNSNASVAFRCDDRPPNGFGCTGTRFCLTAPQGACDPVTAAPVPTISNDTGICFRSVDAGGNRETVKCGTLRITPDFGIALVRPLYGVSDAPRFDLAVSTQIPSSTCKWGAADFNFTTLVRAANIFEAVHPFLFEKANFTDFIAGFPVPNPSLQLSVRCNATTGRISPVQRFEIAYDPTPPRIISAFADPAVVVGGNSVDFVVETDDRTICRYGKGASFPVLTGTFPGFRTPDFTAVHRTTIQLSANDDAKTHTYNVSCMNRAENASSLTPISFTVNFAAEGAITATGPGGATPNTTLTLAVTTNKEAACEYLDSIYRFFAVTGQMQHLQPRSNLSEGAQHIPVRCTFSSSGAVREGSIAFIVDRTPPQLRAVLDGNVSCSLTELHPGFDASDAHSSIVSYDYLVLDALTSKAIANGTIAANNATIADLNLTGGARYLIKAKPRDAAGNLGAELASDGVIATLANDTACQEKVEPTVLISTNTTRSGVSVTLRCEDTTSCRTVTYGLGESGTACSASTSYGSSVLLSRQQFFCYAATDGAGNTKTGSQLILVPDEDSDGILDPFDRCPGTTLGEEVDTDGCSASQRLVDTDGDGLPDQWELQHDAPDCVFDPREPDTDGDGIDDGEDDYNDDGTPNVEHYRLREDPCVLADADSDAIPDAKDRCPRTPTPEITLIITDAASPFYGCGPSERDTDSDGMDDAFEARYCGGSCNPDDDLDGDGLTNLEEYQLKVRFGSPTNPLKKDTDGDGFSDAVEVSKNTNPLDPASRPGARTLALVLLLIGIVLIGAGAFYLLYARKLRRAAPAPQRFVQSPRQPPRFPPRSFAPAKPYPTRRQALHLAEQEKRKRLFRAFEPQAPSPAHEAHEAPLPDITHLFRIAPPDFERLAALAEKYRGSRRTIDAVLDEGERAVFEQLARIAQRAQGKKLQELLSPGQERQLQDIFDELKRIIKEHEGEGVFRQLRRIARK